jgi:hypothetical protein
MPELHDAIRQHASGERGGGEGGEEELRGLRAALREQRARRRSGLVVAPPLRGSLAAPCPTLYGGGGRAAGGEEGCGIFGSIEGLVSDSEVGGCRVVARVGCARAGRPCCCCCGGGGSGISGRGGELGGGAGSEEGLAGVLAAIDSLRAEVRALSAD